MFDYEVVMQGRASTLAEADPSAWVISAGRVTRLHTRRG